MEYFEGGSYRINIEGEDSSIVLNSYSRKYVGSVLDAYGNTIFDYETGAINSPINGNVISADGNIIVDVEGKVITANSIIGNFYNNFGKKVYDLENDTFTGNFNGNIISADLDIIVDVEGKIITADTIIGNLYNNFGEKAYNLVTNTFHGNFNGNIISADLDIIVDVEGKIITADTIIGNLYNSVGEKVYNLENDTFTGNFNGILTGDAIGSLVGNISNTDFSYYFNTTSGEIIADSIEANEIHSNIIGTFNGSLIDVDGATIFDTDNRILKNVNLTGKLKTFDNITAWDPDTGIFTGTFSGDLLGDVLVDNITAGQNKSGCITLNSERDLTQDFSGMDLRYYKTSNSTAGMTMIRGRGTINAPEPVQLGDPLTCIQFGGVVSVDDGRVTGGNAGFIEVKVADTGSLHELKICAEMHLGVFNDIGEQVKAIVIDQNGLTTTTLKDVSIVGETGKTPSNTSTPTKWLEMTVNGSTVFMPLYS